MLIIGGGPSGIDLAHSLSETAKKVIFSHHTHFEHHTYRPNVVKKGDIKRFTRTKVIFEDNSEEAITDVLYCTGKYCLCVHSN